MKTFFKRIDHLTQSTRGLLLMATAWDALIIALLGMLSGPMKQIVTLPIVLVETERIGRLIMLYHSLAIPFVAAIAYYILDVVPTSGDLARTIRRTITPGYMLTSIGGLAFAYLGRNWIFHALLLLGLSLVFYAGVLLTVGLWPWRHPNTDSAYAHIGSVSLERVAFFVTAVAMLLSVIIGAGAGAFFGNGFEAVLAEEIVRQEQHNLGERAVIAHLHIVLALIDVAILLLVARSFDMKGLLHKIAIPLIILGTVVMSGGCWSVMLWEGIAHKIIYAGSSMALLGALLVTISGIDRLIKDQLAVQEIARPTFGQKLRAMLRDPLRFGLFFQLIWLNPVMVFPGLYTAIKLDEFRAWPMEAEYRILVGHWHILATISAVMMILLVADRLGARGWMRQVLGWGVLISANLAFTFAVFYEFLPPPRRPGLDHSLPGRRHWPDPDLFGLVPGSAADRPVLGQRPLDGELSRVASLFIKELSRVASLFIKELSRVASLFIEELSRVASLFIKELSRVASLFRLFRISHGRVLESPTCWGYGAKNPNKFGSPIRQPCKVPETLFLLKD